MTKIQIARDYITRFPDAENRTIARAMNKEQPKVFPNSESARNVIRTLRGAFGDRKAADKSAVRPLGWQKNIMPKTLATPREDFVISGKNRILILSDIHIPYHDVKALKTAIEHGKKQNPTIILLNGDVGDFYAASDHSKDPRRLMSEELDSLRQFLFYLRAQFPKARILYKIGNHETRVERYLTKNAPVVLGIPEFKIQSFLKFDDMGIELVESLQITRLGKLPVIHGHELPKGGGVNPARWLWLKLDETAMCGHFHKTSENIEATGLQKKLTNNWSLGCLCDLSPDYAITNRWNHGFATVEINHSDDYFVANHKIIDGRVY
jgi:predicted phosphodiesterase